MTWGESTSILPGMVSPTPARATRAPRSRPAPRWRIPLVAGLCFGLGYGVVQRLMRLELPRGGLLVESFRMREFPGTTHTHTSMPLYC